MKTPKPLTILAEEGILTVETIRGLKNAWIQDVDALYSLVRATQSSDVLSTKRALVTVLGIQEATIGEFMKRIEPYTSEETINAKQPPKYPLGYKFN
jgi:hypothetical protein